MYNTNLPCWCLKATFNYPKKPGFGGAWIQTLVVSCYPKALSTATIYFACLQVTWQVKKNPNEVNEDVPIETSAYFTLIGGLLRGNTNCRKANPPSHGLNTDNNNKGEFGIAFSLLLLL